MGSGIFQNFQWLLDLLLNKGSSCPRIIVFFRQIRHLAEVFEFHQIHLQEKQYAMKDNQVNSYRNRIFSMFHLTTCDKIKAEVCSSFRDENGLIRVVLCSTSFSMGLDVKCVNTDTYGPSNDTDNYLQESGRAGRDPDIDCNAVLMKHRYSMNIVNISSSMKQYVTTVTCRRKRLMSPFVTEDSDLTVEPLHKCCDNCTRLCRCQCSCSDKCSCVGPVCNGEESSILKAIRLSMTKPQSDEDSNDSDEELEELYKRKPQIVSDSEDSV
ncbi:ATP-dependent DNA helicase tlh1-like [Pecten maximus]|uniref:ATP-dependent DNA helicase tlh1-like n=1 Tax=Pecten maximus TaxID=6579 RepID=UPI001458EDD7|nr:ATP-dependent DNA helicase tlh1-like [Pecten maximus]